LFPPKLQPEFMVSNSVYDCSAGPPLARFFLWPKNLPHAAISEFLGPQLLSTRSLAIAAIVASSAKRIDTCSAKLKEHRFCQVFRFGS